IDDAALERTLEIALLRPRERVIEDHEVGTGLGATCRDLSDLAAPGEQPRIGPGAPSGDDIGDLGACRKGERLELGNALGGLAFAEVELDQQRAVTAAWAFERLD